MTEDELKAALLNADLYLKTRQGVWETPRAIAMIVLAFAAVFAAGGLSTWLAPAKPQVITVKIEGPLAVTVTP